MSRRTSFFYQVRTACLRAALTIVGAVSFSSALSSFAAAQNSDDALVAQEKRRLEELFISKMSEELKLPGETETSFAEAIRSLNREKANANVAVAEALVAIDKAQSSDRTKAKKETEKAVKRYESAWRTYGALPLREVSRLRKILGPEKLGRYLVAKSAMTEKLTALSVIPTEPAKPTATPLASPTTGKK